jgi:hypothetical protein
VRPSRQPLRGFLRLRTFLNAINNIPHAEERLLPDAACGGSSGQAGAFRSTHDIDAGPGFAKHQQFFHTLDAGGLSGCVLTIPVDLTNAKLGKA